MKGSYVLLIKLPNEQAIEIGSLNTIRFAAGNYAYVGSALSGLESRLSHHLKGSNRPHWHIDYLLKRTSLSGIILCQTGERAECTVAEAISHQFHAIPGFGCSDCRCHSHLFFSTDEMKSTIMTTLKGLAEAQGWLIRHRVVK